MLIWVKQDYSKAIEYFQKAADLNVASAFTCLGNMYVNRKGVEKDYSIATEYFKRAAALGDLQGSFKGMSILIRRDMSDIDQELKAKNLYPKDLDDDL